MKKQLAVIVLFVFLFISQISAQSYSVWFTSPSNNDYVAGSVVNNRQSSISFSFSWSGQKQNQNNVWKFKLYRDFITGIEGGSTYGEAWTDENNPNFDLEGYVKATNVYVIYMYEEDYITKALTQRAMSSALYVYVKQTVYIENNFGSGNISVNNNSNFNSGSSVDLWSYIDLSAIENQTDSEGYTRVWNSSGSNLSSWDVNYYSRTNSTSYTYYASSTENGAIITANLKKVCSLTLEGTVFANGSYYYSEPISVVEGNSVTVTAEGYTSSDYIDMGFSSWSDANTQNPRTFTISSNTDYGINYVGIKPNNGYKNMEFVGSFNDNIQITWSEHPNSAVNQYQIWRKVKHNGVLGSATLLASIDRGVQSYTDYDYTYTNGYTDDMLYYDVRAYYSTASSYADPEWNITYGRDGASIVKNEFTFTKKSNEIPSAYSISNYPNPFNPTTTINYQLPQDGFVTLKVYDILGKEIASLVNENKTAGYYNVNFDAGRLTSGIYIYSINVNNFVQSKKMLLVK